MKEIFQEYKYKGRIFEKELKIIKFRQRNKYKNKYKYYKRNKKKDTLSGGGRCRHTDKRKCVVMREEETKCLNYNKKHLSDNNVDG